MNESSLGDAWEWEEETVQAVRHFVSRSCSHNVAGSLGEQKKGSADLLLEKPP